MRWSACDKPSMTFPVEWKELAHRLDKIIHRHIDRIFKYICQIKQQHEALHDS